MILILVCLYVMIGVGVYSAAVLSGEDIADIGVILGSMFWPILFIAICLIVTAFGFFAMFAGRYE